MHGGAALVWKQVAEDIASDIAAGKLPSGTKMPTEVELAEQYGVSRVTIRRAIKELVGENLLTVVHGRGTFVATS